MPDKCCVEGCRSRRRKGVKSHLSFYRIPRDVDQVSEELQRRWLLALRREDWKENSLDNTRVCSAHFISGMITATIIYLPQNITNLPSLSSSSS